MVQQVMFISTALLLCGDKMKKIVMTVFFILVAGLSYAGTKDASWWLMMAESDISQSQVGNSILMETGDSLLLETGDTFLME